MKTFVFILLVLAMCSGGRSQPSATPPRRMILDEMLAPNNLFRNPAAGVSFTYPKGWTIRGGESESVEEDRENIVFLESPRRSRAFTTFSYQLYSESVSAPGGRPIETYMRMVAAHKVLTRLSLGFKDYKNLPDSFAFTEVAGGGVLKYSAKFTRDRKENMEYFVRIFGLNGYVVFSSLGPSADVQALIADVDRMAATVKGPLVDAEGGLKDSLDWLVHGY